MRKDVRTDRTYLVYAESGDAEIRHRVPVGAHGSLMFIHLVGEGDHVVCHAVDAKRMRGAPGINVMTLEELGLRDFAESWRGDLGLAELSCYYEACRRLGVSGAVMVPSSFPAQAADFLRGRGLGVKIDEPFFTHARRIKTSDEIEGITRARRAACAAMDAVSDALARAEATENGALRLDGRALTCAALLDIAQRTLSEHGCLDNGSTVARGTQAAASHEDGKGGLRLGEPVVVGIRPRELGLGCCADLTRTFVKGEPAADVAAAHALAVRAYQAMLEGMRAGIRIARIHDKVVRLAEQDETLQATPVTGYCESFGHGIGLEPYERPFLTTLPGELVGGDVIAVEPSYAVRGGVVAIGDCVKVDVDGADPLGEYPFDLMPRTLAS